MCTKMTFIYHLITPALFCFFLIGGCTSIQPVSTHLSEALSEQADQARSNPHFNYDIYTRLLAKYVNDAGLVDYQKLTQSPNLLETFYAQVAAYSPDSHPAMFPSENHKLAYWINAYNSTVMKGVVEHYPIASVEDVAAPLLLFFFPSKSGFFLFHRFIYGGKQTSLYQLENGVIRKRFGDPRFHFALNCASTSCPKLPKTAFYPETLDQQLGDEAHKFINSTNNIRYDRITNTLYLSSIFKWYKDDFLSWLERQDSDKTPSLYAYILLYADGELSITLRNAKDPNIKFLPYDWGLNDQEVK